MTGEGTSCTSNSGSFWKIWDCENIKHSWRGSNSGGWQNRDNEMPTCMQNTYERTYLIEGVLKIYFPYRRSEADFLILWVFLTSLQLCKKSLCMPVAPILLLCLINQFVTSGEMVRLKKLFTLACCCLLFDYILHVIESSAWHYPFTHSYIRIEHSPMLRKKRLASGNECPQCFPIMS